MLTLNERERLAYIEGRLDEAADLADLIEAEQQRVADQDTIEELKEQLFVLERS